MLNDNLFHYLPVYTTYHQPFTTMYDMEEDPAEEDRRRLYRRAAMLDRDRRHRSFAAALEEQALLEELERRRQHRLYEEEMERRRQQQRLYEQAAMILERKRRQEEQQRRLLYEQEMERRRLEAAAAAALERQRAVEAYQRKMEMKKKQREEAERKRREKMNRLQQQHQYQIVRGPDGNFYRIMLSPAAPERVSVDDPWLSLLGHITETERPTATIKKQAQADDDSETVSTSTDHESISSNDSSIDPSPAAGTLAQDEQKKDTKPVFKNVTFNININHADDNKDHGAPAAPTVNSQGTTSANGMKVKSVTKPTKSLKKKKKKNDKVAMKKSSILIGDVEDASDSECEDEFRDYFHNRRPTTPGTWIEPVEGFGVKTFR